MADQTIPSRVWTTLLDAPGAVLNETDANATVTVDADGTVTFSGPMKWRPAIITEHATKRSDGRMHLVEGAGDEWVSRMQDEHQARVFRRWIIVVDDWTEVPHG